MSLDEPPSLVLSSLAVFDFRNLARVEIEPASYFNIISGDNGQGKTSLLEAMYFVATSRSFRTSKPAELTRHATNQAIVKAKFIEQRSARFSNTREQVAVVQERKVSVRIDGNKPQSLAAYATSSPVVVFHPGELSLSMGAPALRRTLLDRIALHLDPRSGDTKARYLAALRSRQQLLHTSGPNDSAELDAYEELCATYGSELTSLRAKAAEALSVHLAPAFSAIASPDLRLFPAYAPAGSDNVAVARDELRSRRRSDARRPQAAFGPHRDELTFTLNDYPARIVGSQGQHRMIALSVKSAESATIAAIRGVEPILLLDDVSSELDPARTDALLLFLRRAKGQVFVTTTRENLFETALRESKQSRTFRLTSGVVTAP